MKLIKKKEKKVHRENAGTREKIEKSSQKEKEEEEEKDKHCRKEYNERLWKKARLERRSKGTRCTEDHRELESTIGKCTEERIKKSLGQREEIKKNGRTKKSTKRTGKYKEEIEERQG